MKNHSGLPASRVVEFNWNVTAHGDVREGKWMGKWRMEWVASTLHTTSEHDVSSICTADAHTSAASSVPQPAASLRTPVVVVVVTVKQELTVWRTC
jgi:hypothetical protein